MTKYLVRPLDFQIFELDDSNNCYRSYSTRDVTYSNGIRPKASDNFTYDNLTKNYNFFPIEESDLSIYEDKHKVYFETTYSNYLRSNRPDKHGGSKRVKYLEKFMNKLL